jgi:predicted aminopeptidase
VKRGIRAIAFMIELFFIVAFLLSSVFHSLVSYGIDQGIGQLKIVWQARPVTEVLNDPGISDSVKVKLRLIEEIKKFAIDSLGLKASKNYSTLYDQHGKPALWVLTASEQYNLKPYEWKFPVVGKVSYKGFFIYENGKKEEEKLKRDSFDTDFQPTSAWSTLGWFRDPILSNFLFRNEGQIAELIIHEMTHATLYVKSSVDFNENLASAVGEEGAEKFLIAEHGDSSTELLEYRNRNEDYNRFASHMLSGAKQLDSLYQSFTQNETRGKKATLKQQLIGEIVSSLDTVSFHNKKRYAKIFSVNHLPNNAYFLGFTRYDAQKEEMKKELREKFHHDIKKYLYELKIKSGD